jgi:hypothetical protein
MGELCGIPIRLPVYLHRCIARSSAPCRSRGGPDRTAPAARPGPRVKDPREGRVHRYKGHAIRKNVATRHRSSPFGRLVNDPWAAMFDDARRGVTRLDLTDIEPFWVYDGPARIERHVPLIPLSREVDRLERLKRSLAVYRMVFGQPRQEDLVAFLGRRTGY